MESLPSAPAPLSSEKTNTTLPTSINNVAILWNKHTSDRLHITLREITSLNSPSLGRYWLEANMPDPNRANPGAVFAIVSTTLLFCEPPISVHTTNHKPCSKTYQPSMYQLITAKDFIRAAATLVIGMYSTCRLFLLLLTSLWDQCFFQPWILHLPIRMPISTYNPGIWNAAPMNDTASHNRHWVGSYLHRHICRTNGTNDRTLQIVILYRPSIPLLCQGDVCHRLHTQMISSLKHLRTIQPPTSNSVQSFPRGNVHKLHYKRDGMLFTCKHVASPTPRDAPPPALDGERKVWKRSFVNNRRNLHYITLRSFSSRLFSVLSLRSDPAQTRVWGQPPHTSNRAEVRLHPRVLQQHDQMKLHRMTPTQRCEDSQRITKHSEHPQLIAVSKHRAGHQIKLEPTRLNALLARNKTENSKENWGEFRDKLRGTAVVYQWLYRGELMADRFSEEVQ